MLTCLIFILLPYSLFSRIIDVEVFNGIEYARLTDLKNFEEARELCNTLDTFQGATLFKPLNNSQFNEAFLFVSSSREFWLDYEREDLESTDTEPVSYGIPPNSGFDDGNERPWSDEFPQDENNIRRCVVNVRRRNDAEERIPELQNDDCLSRKSIICERPFVNNTIAFKFIHENKEYAFINRLLNFTEANKTCSNLENFPNGELFKIETEELHDRINDLLFGFTENNGRDTYTGFFIDPDIEIESDSIVAESFGITEFGSLSNQFPWFDNHPSSNSQFRCVSTVPREDAMLWKSARCSDTNVFLCQRSLEVEQDDNDVEQDDNGVEQDDNEVEQEDNEVEEDDNEVEQDDNEVEQDDNESADGLEVQSLFFGLSICCFFIIGGLMLVVAKGCNHIGKQQAKLEIMLFEKSNLELE